MEQFLSKESKIFGAAAFVNFYSSITIVALRASVSIGLGFLIIAARLSQNQPLLFLSAEAGVLFFVFEVFYRSKILQEQPVTLGAAKNISDSFTQNTARFLLKNKNKSKISSLLSAFSKEKEAARVFYRADLLDKDIQIAEQAEQKTFFDWSDIINKARVWAEKENRPLIDKLDLLLAAISQSKQIQKQLFNKEIKEVDLLNIIFWIRTIYEKDPIPFWEKPVESLGPGISTLWEGGWTLETEKYSSNLTNQMQRERLSIHLVGRDREIQQVEEILSRGSKKNVILVGPPGIGKTSIVYGLAEKSIRGLLPPALKYKRFLEIDITALLAGAGKGEMEERLQNLLTEVSHADDVILFIPEIENLAGSSGTSTNITGHLINSLSSGKLQVLATTDRENYRRYIEKEGSFASLFETVAVSPASLQSSIRILEEAAPTIESKNKIVITYKSIQKCIELSDRYIVDRELPGKALDLLDEAAAAISIKKKKILEPSDVEEILTQKTKIPISTAKGSEAKQLLDLEQVLHQRIVDQNEAINSISNALRRARTIQREGKKPIGSFLFLGPTGVGKTETAKALAKLYFKSEESIIRVDMSEFRDAASLNKLVGSPPGTEDFDKGGGFTEKVRRDPYSLVLLDEIEKAAREVQEAFLPILDEGVLEDASGKKIIFTNTIIIATSNAGAEFIREQVQQGKDIENLKKDLLEKLQKDGVFKPEFLNRFDDVIVYKPLSESDINQVVEIMLADLAKRLKRQDVNLTVDSQAINWIARQGYEIQYGARPLNRFIADKVEEVLAEKMLRGEIKRGDSVTISIKNNQLDFQSQVFTNP